MRWFVVFAYCTLLIVARQQPLIVNRNSLQHSFKNFRSGLDLDQKSLPGKGIHGFLSAPFFDFVAKATLTILQTKFPNLPIPDTDIDAPVPVLGDIHFMLRNAKIVSIRGNYETTSMTLSDDIIAFDVEELNVQMSGDWRWEKGVAHSHGKVEIAAVKSHIRAVLKITMSENGTAVVGVEDVLLNLGELDIRIYGSKLTWIYNLIKAMFGGTIKDVIESEVPAAVKTLLPEEFNKALQSLPTKYPVIPDVMIDVSILDIAIRQAGLSAFVNSTVFYDKLGPKIQCLNGNEPHFEDNPDWSGKMIQFHVSSQFLNCLMKALHRVKFFEANLTIPFNGEEIFIKFAAMSPPSLTLSADFVTVELNKGRATVSIPDQSDVIIDISTTLSFKISVSTDSSLQLSVEQSSWSTKTISGNIPVTFLPALSNVSFHVMHHFENKLNILGRESFSTAGFKLPWPLNEISLTDLDIVVKKDEVGIGLQFALLT